MPVELIPVIDLAAPWRLLDVIIVETDGEDDDETETGDTSSS